MLDLVLTCGVDISDLVVSPYTSALSDHSLLTFQVVVSCPCDDHQAAFSCRRITPATTSAMADKLPLSLAPLCNCRGSVECLADEHSNVWSAAINPVEKNSSLVQRRNSHPEGPWGCRIFKCKRHSTILVVFRLAWHNSLLTYKNALTRNAYFSSIINLNRNNPKFFSTQCRVWLKNRLRV